MLVYFVEKNKHAHYQLLSPWVIISNTDAYYTYIIATNDQKKRSVPAINHPNSSFCTYEIQQTK